MAHIHDFNLLQQVNDLMKQLKPVSTALDIMQAATIADACHL